MKRSPITRRSAPHRKTAMRRVNPERQANRRKRETSKHRAYMRSETRKIVDARAAGRCEGWLEFRDQWLVGVHSAHRPGLYRCVSSRADNYALQHHHKTYARYGGKELDAEPDRWLALGQPWLASPAVSQPGDRT